MSSNEARQRSIKMFLHFFDFVSSLNRNFFPARGLCFFLFLACCSIPSVGRGITLHYYVGVCLVPPFSYRMDILWGRDGIIIDNKPWPANDTRIDCLKGAISEDGSGLGHVFRANQKNLSSVSFLFAPNRMFFFGWS